MRESDRTVVFDCAVALASIIAEQSDAFIEMCDYIDERVSIAKRIASLSECATALYGVSQNTQELIIAIRDRAPTGLIIRDINSIDRFKSKYCKFYDEAILELFTECTDAIDIIRSRAIYDSFKTIFESFETMSERCYKYILFRD